MILSIETSTIACSVALHEQGALVANQTHLDSKSHSSLLPRIIDETLRSAGVDKNRLKAIAISEGPGSYTGLRIGTSLAKGFSFGLGIPLIAVSTLETMIQPYLDSNSDNYLIPMLDARRMEVYSAIWNQNGDVIRKPEAIVLTDFSYSQFANHRLVLIGNGASKALNVIDHPDYVIFADGFPEARNMGKLAHSKFVQGAFADLDSFEPFYLKSFLAKPPKDLLKV